MKYFFKDSNLRVDLVFSDLIDCASWSVFVPKGPFTPDTDNVEPDFSRLDKLNFEAARFNVRPKDEEDIDLFKVEADKDFFSPGLLVDRSLFSRLSKQKTCYTLNILNNKKRAGHPQITNNTNRPIFLQLTH